jgi:hypothetical protein
MINKIIIYRGFVKRLFNKKKLINLNLKRDSKKIEFFFINFIAISYKFRLFIKIYWKLYRFRFPIFIENYEEIRFRYFLKKKGFKIEAVQLGLNFSPFCRYCHKLAIDNPVITKGYWSSSWALCHPECKKEGEREEAYECQKIDSDCNDCKFFKRIKGIEGTCEKFNKKTTANPNFCSSHNCFEHRKG